MTLGMELDNVNTMAANMLAGALYGALIQQAMHCHDNATSPMIVKDHILFSRFTAKIKRNIFS